MLRLGHRMRMQVALAVLAAVALSFSGPAFGASASLNALRQTSLALVNKDRKAHGLPPLDLDHTLDVIAQSHATDMLRKGYFSHVSPGGGTPMKRFLSAGGSHEVMLRENILHCKGCPQPADAKSVAELESRWMHSPEHRKNILANGITHYGFGLAEDASGGRYAVQDFSGPGIGQGQSAADSQRIAGAQRQTQLAVSIVNGMRKGRSIVAAPALAAAAEASIPDGSFARASLRAIDPLAHLSSAPRFARYRMLMGACGGCGTTVSEGDIRAFIERWAKSAQNRQMLTDPSLAALGMAVAADGSGGKIAVAVLAGN